VARDRLQPSVLTARHLTLAMPPATLVESEILISDESSGPDVPSAAGRGRDIFGSLKRRSRVVGATLVGAAVVLAVVWGSSSSSSAAAASRGQGRVRGSAGLQVAVEVPCKTDDASGKDPCNPLDEKKMTKEIHDGEKNEAKEHAVEKADKETHHSEKQEKTHHSEKHELASASCSAVGENCNTTKCCSGEGMQCYIKDASWAECRSSCVPGPDPVGPDGYPWSCEKLGERSPGKAPVCSKTGEDCSKSQCCADTGMQCYEKVPGFATCKAQCTKGMDLTDTDSTPWNCKPLGDRAPAASDWVAKVCAAPGTACAAKACCSTPGQQCYEKNPYYAECREKCTKPWTCKTRGSRTPLPALQAWQTEGKVADWVADKCSASGDDCRKTKCCSAAGNQCFEKNASWAVCRGSCKAGPDLYDSDSSEWSCNALGPRTPGVATGEPWTTGQNLSKWVKNVCAATGNGVDCSDAKCCKDSGKQCYRKNDKWSTCMTSCTPGAMPGDDSGNWTCEEVGPRTYRSWGSPSIYCFSVVQPANYEPGLVKAQAEKGLGIFACDQFSVFSTQKFFIGNGPLGPVETVTFLPAPVVRSKDYTAGNAELFMHVWDSVRNLGLYKATDWSVKVDPDAVLLPERLRWHLKPHTGEKGYVVNCAKPYMPEGPMMFGAMEAITGPAIQTYFDRAGECTGGLPWQEWGEDLFMGKCLEKLGVARINDFHIYSDGVCTGVDCADPDAAAFHPKKDIVSWMACYHQTFSPHPRVTTQAPQWFKDYMKTYSR